MATHDDEIEALVKASLQAKIIAALKSTPEAIDLMVQAALSKGVDKDTGQFTGYGTRVPYLEWLAGATIRDAARSAVQDIIIEMRPQIDAEIRQRLTAGGVADAVTSALVKATTEDWRISVKFETEKDR